LLLDAQRPGVGEGIQRGGRREIRIAIKAQDNVAEARKGREPGALHRVAQPRTGDEQAIDQSRQDQYDDQRWCNAPEAPRVKGGQSCPPAIAAVREDRSADHKTGDHEEDIDAGKPAGQYAKASMVEQHRQYSDRPQAIDGRNSCCAAV
jgi:hypothetical protein